MGLLGGGVLGVRGLGGGGLGGGGVGCVGPPWAICGVGDSWGVGEEIKEPHLSEG